MDELNGMRVQFPTGFDSNFFSNSVQLQSYRTLNFILFKWPKITLSNIFNQNAFTAVRCHNFHGAQF